MIDVSSAPPVLGPLFAAGPGRRTGCELTRFTLSMLSWMKIYCNHGGKHGIRGLGVIGANLIGPRDLLRANLGREQQKSPPEVGDLCSQLLSRLDVCWLGHSFGVGADRYQQGSAAEQGV